jgi:hypothetical protein
MVEELSVELLLEDPVELDACAEAAVWADCFVAK